MKLVVDFVEVVSLFIFPPNENVIFTNRDAGLYEDTKKHWFADSQAQYLVKY